VKIKLLNPRKKATPAQQRWNKGISRPTSEADRILGERIAACVAAKKSGKRFKIQ
jgi:hypothetical protein